MTPRAPEPSAWMAETEAGYLVSAYPGGPYTVPLYTLASAHLVIAEKLEQEAERIHAGGDGDRTLGRHARALEFEHAAAWLRRGEGE